MKNKSESHVKKKKGFVNVQFSVMKADLMLHPCVLGSKCILSIYMFFQLALLNVSQHQIDTNNM